MNPMQGPRNTGTEEDKETVYSTESSVMDPVGNSSTPSERRPTYTSSSSRGHGAQNHNWWRFGESSSLSGPSDQVGMETNQQLSHAGVHQLGLNGLMVHEGVVHADRYMRDGPTFLRGSSSNVNMSMDMDSDDNSGAQTSGVVFRHGSSLGSSVQAAGESSSVPASSLGVWGSSCKRKSFEGVPTTSFSGETPYCENAGHFHNGASSSLTLATPLQSSPNVTNHFGQTEPMFGTGGGGRSVVATNGFHSVRNADTSSRPVRRLNPRQPQEPVAFSISLVGSSVQQNILPNTPFGDPLETSFTSGENQTNLVHHPALTRNIHQFAWDASSNLSGIEMPQWETPRSNPMFAPTTDIRNHVHDQSMWTRGSSTDSPFVSRARPSSAIHGKQPNPTWILPQSAPIHNNPTRASHISPWSLFPSIESQSTSHGTSLPLLRRGPPFLSSNEPYSSNTRSHRSRQRRSGLLSERQNELLHVRHLGRSLAADSDGRNHLISEIRQVLTAMRRGKSLRIEDYMVLDPLIFRSMTEMHDRHREMRNMSYDELLALGERIGDVSTGLNEDIILKTMKQHQCTSSSVELHQDMEPCCICQTEEYAEGDDLGTLECGHELHKDCIKKWVMLKNLFPICKTLALTT